MGSMTTRIVLVPGFWLGAWAWDEVAPLLRTQGFDVAAMTLPGLAPGPPSSGSRDASAPTLGDQAEAIVAALAVPADRRVLVVHSGAAFPGTLVLDRRPDLVDRAVLVDTAPPKPGLAFDANQVGDLTVRAAWASLEEESAFRDLTAAQLATFAERAVPQPASIVTEPVALGSDARHRVPLTVICTAYSARDYQDYAAQGIPFLAALLDYADVTYVDLPTGHWPMWSRPAELAGLIADASAQE